MLDTLALIGGTRIAVMGVAWLATVGCGCTLVIDIMAALKRQPYRSSLFGLMSLLLIFAISSYIQTAQNIAIWRAAAKGGIVTRQVNVTECREGSRTEAIVIIEGQRYVYEKPLLISLLYRTCKQFRQPSVAIDYIPHLRGNGLILRVRSIQITPN